MKVRDINNKFKKKSSSGAQISVGGGGVRLIWAMPKFKQFFLCVCSLIRP